MAKARQAVASGQVLLATGDADGASSRAYYAMFDAARAALLASGFDVGKTHKGVLNAFSDRLVRNGPLPKELGRLLKRAETFRYVADYEGDPVELSDAREMVEQAAAFVAAMRAAFMPEESNEEKPGMGV
ncbi:HEPN domain-containing protein [Accumulibacter sp.]|uniref:HEPN domain-containing protein n=1 Tax=Accumulibacter sp. TaxID=2053492 RepID=UPI00287AE689|nr:HEPN domain-containing protein [Accumulibacter sp.]MDS4056577.1 HEPN domain-containing protein [Accumulibacter sp.]